MLASPLSPPFLETYCLSMSNLGSNALWIVITFLVLWSICLCFPLVYLKNGLRYVMRGRAQVFIHLIRFLLHTFVSSSFPFLLRYSFLIFPSISTCLMVSVSKMPKYLQVSFLRVFQFCPELAVPFRQSGVVWRFSLLAWQILLYQIPSLCPDCIYSLLPVLFHFSKPFYIVRVH